MTSRTISEEVVESDLVREATLEITRRSVLNDLAGLTPDGERIPLGWNRLLFCASVVDDDASTLAQDAALRIAQGCLHDRQATAEQHDAANALLERMGNWEASRLAVGRELAGDGLWQRSSGASTLDLVRRRMELSLTLATGTRVGLNPFQRAFWTAALTHDWVSVSAPTSAGKSFIVKRWLEDLAGRSGSLKFVYLVPTRALIEEVTNDLRGDPALSSVKIHNLPWSTSVGESAREVFVMTQERVHLLQSNHPEIVPEVFFVDEAQKFGDDSRGVLLQRVLDEAVRRNPTMKLIFASPLTSNPSILLQGAPEAMTVTTVDSESVTVNQNLLWANQVKGRPQSWMLSLIHRDVQHSVGTFELPDSPKPASKRLAYVAVTLGREQSGNLVYANGAEAAEKAAQQIADEFPGDLDERDPEIASLIELVETTIHSEYGLADSLRHGVAFHYGNMPLIVRSEIERLFKDERINYLVCTSTLLEGVNLPCRAIYVREPKKGIGNPMTSYDFWNLAGRAGRWGTEFEGNIVCVDTEMKGLWSDAPRSRVRQPITRASDAVLNEAERLIAYIRSGTPIASSAEWPLAESVFSFLADRVARGVPVENIPGLVPRDESLRNRMIESVRQQISGLSIPANIFGRHPGISPLAMERLLNRLRQSIDVTQLALRSPQQAGAFDSYATAMGLCVEYLGAPFGTTPRQRQLALLIMRWMSGYPLARLIDDRVGYYRDRREKFSMATEIRNAMSDVEKFARFEAPKYLACYSDLISFRQGELGQAVNPDAPDIAMMLELGVSRRTEMSLMALGLSRTSAVEVGRLIETPDLDPAAVAGRLSTLNVDGLRSPALVRREIDNLRERLDQP